MTIRIEQLADTPFQRRMARGHELRLGHPLNAVQVTSDGILWHTVRLCCGEEIPTSVESWADHTPTPDKPSNE